MAYRCLGSDIYWQLGNFSCLDYHVADIMQPWTQGQVYKCYYQQRDTVSLVAMTYRITRYYTQRANITSRDNSSYLTFSCMLCGVYSQTNYTWGKWTRDATNSKWEIYGYVLQCQTSTNVVPVCVYVCVYIQNFAFDQDITPDEWLKAKQTQPES